MRGVSTRRVAYLLAVSVVWALSFGLIKTHLAGVDPALVAALRLALALAVFLPFWRPSRLSLRQTAALALLGGVQFGFMYIAYLRAFAHLAAHEVALLTIFTPLLVWALEDIRARRFAPRTLLAASLAVLGAGAVFARADVSLDTVSGILWVQASNLCFAFGQVAYRALRAGAGQPDDRSVFATLYLGALAATLPFALPAWGDVAALTGGQWLVLVYLGTVASGLGFFFWNLGATRVNAGVLAALNNAKVPLGLAASILVFGERGDPVRLVVGGALVVAALLVARRS